MKNKIITVITVLILLIGIGFNIQCYAISDEQSAAIQSFLDEACRKSGTPGISVSILYEGETFFFSSGYANHEEKLSANENTLYELASVSKAFTGVGILLLEEQGLLSMTDPIDKYLPWLSFRYKGKSVDMSKVTLNDFLHHTSGLTNQKHFNIIPAGNTPDMLKKTVEVLIDTELAFSPGERYEYGTVNFDVLALVIEYVSGQSFEDYMREQVFEPLGLHNTYLYIDQAKATGKMAQGYRTSFFITTPYDAPEYGGNKAAGYIITSAYDMARWMGIHLGIIDDIPEIFRSVITKSHEGNKSNIAENELFYAAGWLVNNDLTFISHAGGNPTFKTNVFLYPEEKVGICLLSNGSNMNSGAIGSIKDILDGNLSQSYQIGGLQPIDIILSCVTIVAGLLAVMFLFLGIRRKKLNGNQKITKRRLMLLIFWLAVIVVMGVLCCVFPAIFGGDWSYMFVWMPYSIPAALIALFLLSANITWFVCTNTTKKT